MLSLPKTLKIIASYLVWVAKFLTEVGHIFCLDDMHQCLMAAKEVLDPIVSHYILSVELGTCAILSFRHFFFQDKWIAFDILLRFIQFY